VSLRLIFGRAGTGKSTQCLEEILRDTQSDPFGEPLIFLVPEQATHQMEMKLAHAPELGGILRAQVLSFRRLGWRVFSETGGGQKILIGEIGKRMLLRRLLLKNRSKLQVFARSATRPGMADLLAQAIAEFKTYRITPNDLRLIQDTDELLVQKLEELALLYDDFNQSLGHDVRDPDDELTVVAEKLPFAQSLEGAKIWVDGFKGFTPQELYILQVLLGIAKQVTITLPLDPLIVQREDNRSKYYNATTVQQKIPREEVGLLKPGEEVFTGPWQTYQSIIRIALESGIYIENSIFLEEGHRFKNPWLKHLEKFYNTYPTLPYIVTTENRTEPLENKGISLFSAVNRRAEVEGVARELRRLVREEGKHWKNLSVMTRDLSGYEEIVEQVFRVHEIPFFLDNKRPVIHHPLLELLLSALEAARTDWTYEPLFRCLKTDFFPIGRDSLDRVENYCIAHGIRGEAWSSGRNWSYRSKWTNADQELQHFTEKEQENLINRARQVVYDLLNPFIRALEPPLQTVRQTTEALYDLLIRLEVPKHLQEWAEEARSKGDLAEARLQEQIWGAVIEVLDEMVAGLGDEQLELSDYALILSSGIENLKLGLIPPGLDQVLIGSLERSRNPEVDVLFLLGANEGILPAKPSTEGVFDGIERERLEHSGLTLAPKGKAQLFEEQFFIYTALTRATEKFYISYPLTDEEGKGLPVSPVINRLKTVFPGLTETYLGNVEDELSLISHPHAILPAYAIQLLELRQGKSLSPLWEAIQKWFHKEINNHSQIQLLEKGITAENTEEKIPKPLARRLYGKRLLTSVSRLEKFARCPFAHYSQYGLKLKERSTFSLSSPDMGQFFHAVLHDFALTVRERQLNWGQLSKHESWGLVSELSEKITPNLQNEILLSNARYRYLTHKLKRTVHHAVRVLGEHARQGVFLPIQLEVKFGPSEALPGIAVPLTDGNSLTLRGQIDRIDGALLEDQVYLRILDYKSRQPRVTLNQIYYGLDLQLLAYLDAALQGAEILLGPLKGLNELNQVGLQGESTQGLQEIAATVAEEQKNYLENMVHPAGFLYFPVLEPQLESQARLTDEQMEHERIKAVKVKGYLLANRQVLQAMDRDLVGGDSDLLGLKIKKDGDFKKGSPILTEEQFTHLRKHLHHFLQTTGEEILDGNISIAPYRHGKENACQYCSYKPVCHFDPYLPENPYRTLPVLKDPEIWNRIESIKEEFHE
jgi:ATP-dependent helicase/nuclease subunit B